MQVNVISPHLGQQVFACLDNLHLIIDPSGQHLLLFSEIANHMRCAGLTLNNQKSEFVMKEASASNILGNGAIYTDPSKVISDKKS